jgi:hypothetical protein
MASTVNTVAVRAAALKKLQQVCAGFTYNIAAFNECVAFLNANAITYTNVQSDLFSWVDNGSTGSGANNGNDFTTIAPQMTVAELSAMVANMTTWVNGISGATAGQMATMAGQPMV